MASFIVFLGDCDDLFKTLKTAFRLFVFYCQISLPEMIVIPIQSPESGVNTVFVKGFLSHAHSGQLLSYRENCTIPTEKPLMK